MKTSCWEHTWRQGEPIYKRECSSTQVRAGSSVCHTHRLRCCGVLHGRRTLDVYVDTLQTTHRGMESRRNPLSNTWYCLVPVKTPRQRVMIAADSLSQLQFCQQRTQFCPAAAPTCTGKTGPAHQGARGRARRAQEWSARRQRRGCHLALHVRVGARQRPGSTARTCLPSLLPCSPNIP